MYIIQLQLIMVIMVIILQLKVQIIQGDPSYDNKIFVNQTGSNDRSCWEGNYWNPCSSINLALQGLKNKTAIHIQKGNYTLSADDSTSINYLSNIGIIGNGSADEVVIQCQQNSGLSFNYSDSIEVRNLLLVKCGANRTSASKKFEVSKFEFVQFRVTVYILFCINLTVDNVHIESSIGTGLVMYNVAGDVTVSNSNISNSKPQTAKEVGAGGLHIEFTYCIPGNTECQVEYKDSYVPTNYSSYSTYFIHNNNIQYNKASLGVYSTLYNVDDENSRSMEFGAGGGLSVIFKGIATNNTFVIYNNTFSYNCAIYGGGFYFGFLDSAMNNSIFMSTLNCLNNDALSDSDQKSDTWYTDGGGGCGKIMMYISIAIGEQHNIVVISNSSLSNNIGLTGGGLEIEVDYATPTSIELNNVTFFNNSAFLGAAMYAVEKETTSEHIIPFSLSINNSRFLSNIPICKLIANSFAMLPCSGVIYLSHRMELTIQGELIFANNGASALEIHSSWIYFTNQSNVTFQNNTSEFGGAIALYDCSYLSINHDVTLLFLNNSAQYKGGAIYAKKCRSNNQPTSHTSLCFIQNNDIGENFTFVGNTVGGKPNAIYTGSVIPCYASSGYKPTFWNSSVLNKTFCWHYFHYDEDYNCSMQCKSDPEFMTVLQNKEKAVYPGNITSLPINVFDGWNQTIQNVLLQVCVYSGQVMLQSQQTQQLSNCVTTINKEVTIFVKNCSNYINDSFELKIAINDNKQLSVRLLLNFKECPKPLATIDKHYSECTFRKTLASNGLHCSTLSSCDFKESTNADNACSFSSYVYVSVGQCVSLMKESNKTYVIASHCPPYFPNMTFCKPILSITDPQTATVDSCNNGRFGRLCGKCKDGIAVNSPSLHCGKCHELSGLIYFGVQIVPITIFILYFMSVLHHQV